MKLEPWLMGRPKKAKVVADDDNPYAGARRRRASTRVARSARTPARSTPHGRRGRRALVGARHRPTAALRRSRSRTCTESGGPIARRMVKGFFLSLDHQFDAAGTTWWKTVGNMSAPANRIIVQQPVTEFHGVWLGKDDATFATKDVPARRIDKLPVGFVLHQTKHWLLDDGHKTLSLAPNSTVMNRFDAVGLTGEKARVGGIEYWETDEGWWLRSVDATRTEPGPAPERLGEHEKWIDVNLKRQTLVAFEGTTPVFVTLVSSGRNEHETPPGSFHIREKHIAATMDADTAADGPYSIEDVPYIEYFNGGYALHGAFWHAEFGHVKSHGCVNLAPWDAKALFGWTDPQLPPGWHAVFATQGAARDARHRPRDGAAAPARARWRSLRSARTARLRADSRPDLTETLSSGTQTRSLRFRRAAHGGSAHRTPRPRLGPRPEGRLRRRERVRQARARDRAAVARGPQPHGLRGRARGRRGRGARALPPGDRARRDVLRGHAQRGRGDDRAAGRPRRRHRRRSRRRSTTPRPTKRSQIASCSKWMRSWPRRTTRKRSAR